MSTRNLLSYVLSFTGETGFYHEQSQTKSSSNTNQQQQHDNNKRTTIYTTPGVPRAFLQTLKSNTDFIIDPLVEQGGTKKAQGWSKKHRDGDEGDGAGAVASTLNLKECILMLLRSTGRAMSPKEIARSLLTPTDLSLHIRTSYQQSRSQHTTSKKGSRPETPSEFQKRISTLVDTDSTFVCIRDTAGSTSSSSSSSSFSSSSSSSSSTYWYAQTPVESNKGIKFGTSLLQNKRKYLLGKSPTYILANGPSGRNTGLIGKQKIKVFWPADVLWYEAEVLSSVRQKRGKRRESKARNTNYMIRYLADDVIEKINLEEHLIRLMGESKGSSGSSGGSGGIDEGKTLTLKTLVLEGLARPGLNRLICLNGNGAIRVMSLLSDGRIQCGTKTYDTVENFLHDGNVSSAGAGSGSGSSSLEMNDPWQVIRYRLPNHRSVCLGRLRQLGIDLDKTERKKRKELESTTSSKKRTRQTKDTTTTSGKKMNGVGGNKRRSTRQKKTVMENNIIEK